MTIPGYFHTSALHSHQTAACVLPSHKLAVCLQSNLHFQSRLASHHLLDQAYTHNGMSALIRLNHEYCSVVAYAKAGCGTVHQMTGATEHSEQVNAVHACHVMQGTHGNAITLT